MKFTVRQTATVTMIQEVEALDDADDEPILDLVKRSRLAKHQNARQQRMGSRSPVRF
jgi:hypothetical protein